MHPSTENKAQWEQFELLSAFSEIKHGSSPRGWDYSGSPEEPRLAELVDQLQTQFAIPQVQLLQQVHGTEVHILASWQQQLVGDAAITQRPGLALMIRHADCQVALMFDPVTRTIAATHCGWRGLMAGMYSKVIDQLKSIGVNPANLQVALSASLGPCHAEFRNYREEIPKRYWGYQVRPTYFNLWAIAEAQLLDCGVLAKQMQRPQACSFALPERYYSYRRDKATARHGTWIALVP